MSSLSQLQVTLLYGRNTNCSAKAVSTALAGVCVHQIDRCIWSIDSECWNYHLFTFVTAWWSSCLKGWSSCLKNVPTCEKHVLTWHVLEQAKASLRMGLEDITDTSGTIGGLKWIGFFGASFIPSLFLAGYFLGGYYPPMALGASEPDWWPTAMQVLLNFMCSSVTTLHPSTPFFSTFSCSLSFRARNSVKRQDDKEITRADFAP